MSNLVANIAFDNFMLKDIHPHIHTCIVDTEIKIY